MGLKKKVTETPVEEPVVTETIEEAVTEVPVEEPAPKKSSKTKMSVNTECLNIRNSAGGDVIGRLYRGETITVDSVNGEWAKISKPVKGYCMVQYLI